MYRPAHTDVRNITYVLAGSTRCGQWQSFIHRADEMEEEIRNGAKQIKGCLPYRAATFYSKLHYKFSNYFFMRFP